MVTALPAQKSHQALSPEQPQYYHHFASTFRVVLTLRMLMYKNHAGSREINLAPMAKQQSDNDYDDTVNIKVISHQVSFPINPLLARELGVILTRSYSLAD